MPVKNKTLVRRKLRIQSSKFYKATRIKKWRDRKKKSRADVSAIKELTPQSSMGRTCWTPVTIKISTLKPENHLQKPANLIQWNRQLKKEHTFKVILNKRRMRYIKRSHINIRRLRKWLVSRKVFLHIVCVKIFKQVKCSKKFIEIAFYECSRLIARWKEEWLPRSQKCKPYLDSLHKAVSRASWMIAHRSFL